MVLFPCLQLPVSEIFPCHTSPCPTSPSSLIRAYTDCPLGSGRYPVAPGIDPSVGLWSNVWCSCQACRQVTVTPLVKSAWRSNNSRQPSVAVDRVSHRQYNYRLMSPILFPKTAASFRWPGSRASATPPFYFGQLPWRRRQTNTKLFGRPLPGHSARRC